ncbi:MAG: class IV adenylate cyclase [Chloroflexi bacterium]|nr:class IV adenylate cyclase [Chloroflexota bacterium]
MAADLEIEVKFLVADLGAVEAQLRSLGATCLQPRTLERNLRFDTDNGALTRARRVLRLRRDVRATLTYKAAPEVSESVSARQELEVEVADEDAARRILEALGYRVSWAYEKYRATYEMNRHHIMLDQLPFGDFVEIEGETPETIEHTAQSLGLDWRCRILESYSQLFKRLRTHGIASTDLTFEEFSGVEVTPAALGVSMTGLSL